MSKEIILQKGQQILDKIAEFDIITIFGHSRPDGDCYGCQFGLKALLEANYPEKEIHVLTQSLSYVQFLGHGENVENETIAQSLAIVCDTGSADRISDQRYATAQFIIKIDHHIASTHYGELVLCLDEYPAASQIIAQWAMLFHLQCPLSAAEALYIGIMTDTGGFRYRGVDSTTFCVAGWLLEQGVYVEKINEKLSVKTIEELKFQGEIINRIVMKNNFLYCVLTREILERNNVDDEVASSMVSVFSGIEGYPIWALILENSDHSYRIRLRSTSEYNIEPLARQFAGGGHAQAAGGKLTSKEYIKTFVESAIKYLKNYVQWKNAIPFLNGPNPAKKPSSNEVWSPLIGKKSLNNLSER